MMATATITHASTRGLGSASLPHPGRVAGAHPAAVLQQVERRQAGRVAGLSRDARAQPPFARAWHTVQAYLTRAHLLRYNGEPSRNAASPRSAWLPEHPAGLPGEVPRGCRRGGPAGTRPVHEVRPLHATETREVDCREVNCGTASRSLNSSCTASTKTPLAASNTALPSSTCWSCTKSPS